MMMENPLKLPPIGITSHWRARSAIVIATLSISLTSCGGGSSNPLDNPPTISNPTEIAGKSLSFVYYQKCINPIFLAQLPIQGTATTNTCASSGCHETTTGAGGALRIIQTAQPLDVSDPANTASVIRASDMYKNFYSTQGAVLIGSPIQSRLLNKPLLRGVLHGGGTIFIDELDPNAKLIAYWISRPVPVGQDEFSNASDSMFTPPDPKVGTCNTQ